MMPCVYLAVMTLGQCYPAPPICQPVYVDTVVDRVFIQNITERYRTYERVSYGGEWRRVPVINGYVPEMAWSRRGDGGFNIYYDYSGRIPLQECSVFGMEKERPSRSKTKEPERQPLRDSPEQVRSKPKTKLQPKIEDYDDLPENSVMGDPDLNPIAPKFLKKKRMSDVDEPDEVKYPSYRLEG